MVGRRSLTLVCRVVPVLVAFACLAPAEAGALKALLSRHNQSQVHTWDSNNPGASVLLHTTKCNDADYNLPEGSTFGWIAEHNQDYFARFIVGSNMGFDQQYILGQGGRVHYDYPKHVTVHNGEIVVMSRNDGTLWRYTNDGVQLGSVKTSSNTGQGMASDGTSLFVSLWNGAASTFVRYDAAFVAQQNFNNPAGIGNFNNIVDLVYDPASTHFFGLATSGEGGTGTESTTVLEFEMGGMVIKSYALPFACDGIGSFVDSACGDGKLAPGEECDDGNVVNTDACTATCKQAKCGDSFVQAGVEACDDGNAVDTDLCTSACQLAKCGDGFVQDGVEACDDGNAEDTDACTSACVLAKCGDGLVQAGVESCDDGNDVDDDACSNACVAASCGDGVVQDGEMCDDPNDPNCVDCMLLLDATTGTTGGTTGDTSTTDATTTDVMTTDVMTTDATQGPTTGAPTTSSGTGGTGGGTGDPTETDPTSPTDSGPPPTTDATTSSSSGSTGSSETPIDDGGCGCRSATDNNRGALLTLLGLLALTRPRRRRSA